MSDQRGGFDPRKLGEHKRPNSVISEFLSETNESRARGFTEIRVLGVGGAGGNTVNRMIETGVRGIEFIAVNSDLQALQSSRARRKIAIGQRLTRGLGTGGNPKLGLQAAEQDTESIEQAVEGADMVFVTAGLGGGTGTGAAPYVAALAHSSKALTVGIVTRPFRFEGRRRQEIADAGIVELRDHVDALIVIANERLLQIAPPRSNLLDAFRLADEVLQQGITGVADLVITPGIINLDFADVYAVMSRSGSALMAIGKGRGEDRAAMAAESAMNSPLLEGSLTGARGILLNVIGGPDMTLHDVQSIAESIGAKVAPDANTIVGTSVHPHLEDEIRLTLIATGFQ
ncbi:MAG TPA: cell division protein FtsZ [Chloroflexota bacterium]|nr:cell division protein FtsZ [Chloroflexota bacterium]